MKKLYTLAAVAAIAMSASAQLYVVGDGDGIAWDAAAPLTVELTDGNYTFTITNCKSLKISNAFGDWDTYNAGYKFAQLTADNLGETLNLVTPEDVNSNISMPWSGDYTFVVNADFTTLVATTTTPAPTGAVDVYLRGGMNDWGTPDNWKMESADGVTYWFDCQGETMIPTGTEFKIADADWNLINYGAAGEVWPDSEFASQWFHNANNSVMGEDYTGTIKAVLTGALTDKAPLDVTVYEEIVEHGDAGVENVVVDANAPKEYFNLQGVRVANPENGLYIVRQGNNVSKVLVK